MSKENSSKVKNRLLSVLKFLLLIIICVAASILIVWPLWKFSTCAPKVYTIIILVLLGIFFLYLIIKKIRKSSRISVVRFFVNLVLICGGLYLIVRNVLFEHKLMALLFFALAVILVTAFNLILNKLHHE